MVVGQTFLAALDEVVNFVVLWLFWGEPVTLEETLVIVACLEKLTSLFGVDAPETMQASFALEAHADHVLIDADQTFSQVGIFTLLLGLFRLSFIFWFLSDFFEIVAREVVSQEARKGVLYFDHIWQSFRDGETLFFEESFRPPSISEHDPDMTQFIVFIC